MNLDLEVNHYFVIIGTQKQGVYKQQNSPKVSEGFNVQMNTCKKKLLKQTLLKPAVSLN